MMPCMMQVPPAADPSVPLDRLILKAFTMDKILPPEAKTESTSIEQPAVISIAERFKNAYLDTRRERAEKSAVKAERNYRQRKSREMRKSGAQLAIKKFLDA